MANDPITQHCPCGKAFTPAYAEQKFCQLDCTCLGAALQASIETLGARRKQQKLDYARELRAKFFAARRVDAELP